MPFEVDLLGSPSPLAPNHSTKECSASDHQHTSTNPITGQTLCFPDWKLHHFVLILPTGLVIYRPDTDVKPPLPLYSAVRASATGSSDDWFQSNLPASSPLIPSWATRIGRTVRRLAAKEDVIDAPDDDSDPEGSEGEFEDADLDNNDGSGRSHVVVHPYRFRFWGFAASPGGGSSVALVTKYNTQLFSRKGFCKLLFASFPSEKRPSGVVDHRAAVKDHLTTEGRMWEWMYGEGLPVPGVTCTTTRDDAHDSAMDVDEPTREIFAAMRDKQKCVFCNGHLRFQEDEATCAKGHSLGESSMFCSFLDISSPIGQG